MSGIERTARAEGTLARLAVDIRACRTCLDHPERPLPHEPRPVVRLSATARLCIAGQAPGTKVHATGLPFNDASGDRLRDWMGVTRDEFYDAARIAIVPMGFCYPGQDTHGGDLPPRAECRGQWHDRIFPLMPQIELVLAIGQHAQRYHIASAGRASMTDMVRSWRESLERPAHPRVLPLPHPSWRNTGWIKRNPWFETEVLPVLKAEVRRLLR